jgi:hypothetical protein
VTMPKTELSRVDEATSNLSSDAALT